jgi:hypothetical protein
LFLSGLFSRGLLKDVVSLREATMQLILKSLCFIFLFISFKAHSTLTIITKDPASGYYIVGMITSGPVAASNIARLLPGQKIGISGWGV